MADYSRYRYLDVTVGEDGVALVEIPHPLYNLETDHWELTQIWRDLDDDPDVRASVLTWVDPPRRDSNGTHGSPKLGVGNKLDLHDPGVAGLRISSWMQVVRESREGIRNVLNSHKLIVSAIRGYPSYGHAMILATLADVSVAAEDVIIADRHVETGVPAGDGIVYWAMLCGVQKAKLLALTCDAITGEEAERIGLVSIAVPSDQTLEIAMGYARRFAKGPQHAQNFTKRAMNSWLHLTAVTSFEAGIAWEMVGMLADPDAATQRADPHYRGQGERPIPGYDKPDYPSVQHPYGSPGWSV